MRHVAPGIYATAQSEIVQHHVSPEQVFQRHRAKQNQVELQLGTQRGNRPKNGHHRGRGSQSVSARLKWLEPIGQEKVGGKARESPCEVGAQQPP